MDPLRGAKDGRIPFRFHRDRVQVFSTSTISEENWSFIAVAISPSQFSIIEPKHFAIVSKFSQPKVRQICIHFQNMASSTYDFIVVGGMSPPFRSHTTFALTAQKLELLAQYSPTVSHRAPPLLLSSFSNPALQTTTRSP